MTNQIACDRTECLDGSYRRSAEPQCTDAAHSNARSRTNFSKRATNDMSDPDDEARLTAQRGLGNGDNRRYGCPKAPCAAAVSWCVPEARK
jgi:hypothetical protein